jgi:hypothetical protein
VTGRVTNPNCAIATIGATTTICPQQHRQPSARQPSSESGEVCVENGQTGDAIASQERISVVARSSKKTVTTLRTIRRSTMVDCPIMPQKPSRLQRAVLRRCHFRTVGASLKGAAVISARSRHASSMIWLAMARTARERRGGWLWNASRIACSRSA